MANGTKKRLLGYGKKMAALMLGALLLGAAPAVSQPASPDVALVTRITGAVTYGTEGAGLRPAQAFMKLRQGDRVEVPGGGALQLVFFANGRQETWSGPARLMIGEAAAQAVGSKEPRPEPQVVVWPAKATKRLMEAAPFSGESLRYTGTIQTMAPRPASQAAAPAKPLTPQAQKDLAEAQKTYRRMLRGAAPDDITSELYYLSVLADHGQTAAMAEVAAALAAKRPGDPAVKKIQDWVRGQSASAPRP